MDLFTFLPHQTEALDRQAQAALKDAGLYRDDIDGDFGSNSMAALGKWDAANGVHRGLASSFADPADVRAYRAAKAKGWTDQQAFKVGDNGIGMWGDDCSMGSGPACAVPPEYWHQLPSARFAAVEVAANGERTIAKLKDTMPHLANIHNGAVIDMSPDLCASLGVTPPVMIKAAWRFVSVSISTQLA